MAEVSENADWFSEWRQEFVAKLDRPVMVNGEEQVISPGEKAVFLALLQGFSQGGNNQEKAAEVVAKSVVNGELNFWGQKLPITSRDVSEANFDQKKWADLAREAEIQMHKKVGRMPKSMLMASRSEREDSDKKTLESVRVKVLENLEAVNESI